VFPDNVGVFMKVGYPVALGMKFPLVVMHRGARRFLGWWKRRRRSGVELVQHG
jgi:hypothetical protein